jgi:hypothetical protein
VDRPPADVAGAGRPDAAHRHLWSVLGFLVADDRPMMRQRCSCGAERKVPAWDRQWQPPDEEQDPA